MGRTNLPQHLQGAHLAKAIEIATLLVEWALIPRGEAMLHTS